MRCKPPFANTTSQVGNFATVALIPGSVCLNWTRKRHTISAGKEISIW